MSNKNLLDISYHLLSPSQPLYWALKRGKLDLENEKLALRNEEYEKFHLLDPYLQDKHNLKHNLYLFDKTHGWYLVSLRVFNNDDKKLVYGYIYYPNVFIKSLYAYFIFKYAYKTFNEWGHYITIFEKELLTLKQIQHMKEIFYSEGCSYIFRIHDRIEDKLDIHSVYNIISQFVFVQDSCKISFLVDLAYKRDYIGYLRQLLGYIKFYQLIENSLLKYIESTHQPTISVINSSLFIVDDIQLFVKKIKERGYDISQGPKTIRAEVSSIDSFLLSVDREYRTSLYNHHLHHMRGYENPLMLTRDKFSYRNIHMNLGNKKWYSTQILHSCEKIVKIFNIHSYVFKRSLSTDKYIMFNKVNNMIKAGGVNEETQLKIEEYLYNFNISTVNLDHTSIYEYLETLSFNKKFQKRMVETYDTLSGSINNFKKRKLHCEYKVKDLNQKNKAYYYLSVILDKFTTDFVISILLGQFVKIMQNPREENNNCLSVFRQTGEHLINYYLASLFQEQRQKILKNNKDIKYTMSDWKIDNKDLVDVYENVDLVHRCNSYGLT